MSPQGKICETPAYLLVVYATSNHSMDHRCEHCVDHDTCVFPACFAGLLLCSCACCRLKFKAAVNTQDWTAYAKFGLRTERIAPLNVREGFTLCRRVPLDGNRGASLLTHDCAELKQLSACS
jgi:hypothetical protein